MITLREPESKSVNSTNESFPGQAARIIVVLVLFILGVLVVAVRDTTRVLLDENELLREQLVVVTGEQQNQRELLQGLAEGLFIQLEGLRTETSDQLAAARQTVAATKKELETAIAEQQEITLTEVVNTWRGRIAYLECNFNFLGAKLTQRGAATFFVQNGKPILVTNRHVVEPFSGQYIGCYYRFPQDDDNIQFPKSVISYGSQKDTENPDYATVELTSPNDHVQGLMQTAKQKFCTTEPQIGDEVIILGFPTIGSNRDVTATEGIIAAIEDDHYVTSAKVDSGNSGGAAIHVDNQCYLGIPTFTALGQAESLARILRSGNIDF